MVDLMHLGRVREDACVKVTDDRIVLPSPFKQLVNAMPDQAGPAGQIASRAREEARKRFEAPSFGKK